MEIYYLLSGLKGKKSENTPHIMKVLNSQRKDLKAHNINKSLRCDWGSTHHIENKGPMIPLDV